MDGASLADSGLEFQMVGDEWSIHSLCWKANKYWQTHRPVVMYKCVICWWNPVCCWHSLCEELQFWKRKGVNMWRSLYMYIMQYVNTWSCSDAVIVCFYCLSDILSVKIALICYLRCLCVMPTKVLLCVASVCGCDLISNRMIVKLVWCMFAGNNVQHLIDVPSLFGSV